MPLYDFECEQCGRIFEEQTESDREFLNCPSCNNRAKKIISCGRGRWREDAPWLESVRAIVDKDSTKAEAKAFLASPTRQNRKRWMAAEGLREMCEGEKPIRREQHDTNKIAERLMQRHMERKALVIR